MKSIVHHSNKSTKSEKRSQELLRPVYDPGHIPYRRFLVNVESCERRELWRRQAETGWQLHVYAEPDYRAPARPSTISFRSQAQRSRRQLSRPGSITGEFVSKKSRARGNGHASEAFGLGGRPRIFAECGQHGLHPPVQYCD